MRYALITESNLEIGSFESIDDAIEKASDLGLGEQRDPDGEQRDPDGDERAGGWTISAQPVTPH